MPAKKKPPSKGRVKIRGARETAENLTEAASEYRVANPIKKLIKLNLLPWTSKQKDFFKLALSTETKVMFVSGPAGTAKTLLSTYCALQLLNMKVISDIMYLRSAVESSAQSLGFLPGSADDKLKFYNLPFLDKLY